jgi:hypothetical protein
VPEENGRVAVRRLPDGIPQPALLESFKGTVLQVTLLSDATSLEFPLGALVEVGSEQALYLGEVQGCRASLRMVAVEHVLTRSSLSALQNVWQCSQGA